MKSKLYLIAMCTTLFFESNVYGNGCVVFTPEQMATDLSKSDTEILSPDGRKWKVSPFPVWRLSPIVNITPQVSENTCKYTVTVTKSLKLERPFHTDLCPVFTLDAIQGIQPNQKGKIHFADKDWTVQSMPWVGGTISAITQPVNEVNMICAYVLNVDYELDLQNVP